MRAITLYQPWASLWIGGAKVFETRSWMDSRLVGERIAVHASTKFTRDTKRMCYLSPFAAALGAMGFNNPGDLPMGCVLGTLVIDAIYSTNDLRRDIELSPFATSRNAETMRRHLAEAQRSDEQSFGDFSPNRYIWHGTDRDRLRRPIPWRGERRLWYVPMELRHLMNGGKDVTTSNSHV